MLKGKLKFCRKYVHTYGVGYENKLWDHQILMDKFPSSTASIAFLTLSHTAARTLPLTLARIMSSVVKSAAFRNVPRPKSFE